MNPLENSKKVPKLPPLELDSTKSEAQKAEEAVLEEGRNLKLIGLGTPLASLDLSAPGMISIAS